MAPRGQRAASHAWRFLANAYRRLSTAQSRETCGSLCCDEDGARRLDPEVLRIVPDAKACARTTDPDSIQINLCCVLQLLR